MSTLPLNNDADRTFTVIIFDAVYNIRQLWNTLGFWTINIADESNAALVNGVKIVTRTNLINQYANVPFNLRSEKLNDPVRDNLDEFSLEIIQKNA